MHVNRSKGQGYRVMKCAAGVGMYVHMTAQVSSFHFNLLATVRASAA